MKKYPILLFILMGAVFLLENCKHDPPITPHNGPGDPDSLYIGTAYANPYNNPAVRFIYPTPRTHYMDSLTYEGIQLGRRLFYDKRLSLTGQMACASCHKLTYGFGDNVAFSNNVFMQNTRNAPPLANLAWAPYFFWDGRQPTAAAQAEDAFQHELGMNVTNAITTLEGDSVDVYLFKKAFGRPGAITANRIYLAVQEFLLSAVSYNSRFDSVQRGEEHFTAKERYGFDSVFTQELGECSHCHAYGNNDLLYDAVHPFRNNALDSARVYTDYKDPGRGAITGNPSDYGLFKAPSLRNVAVSGPYMHDARYKTLRQVIDFYSDSLQFSPYLESFMLKHFDKDSTGAALQHGGMHLSEYDKEALIDLINSMTDYVYLNNPDLKDPY